MHRLLTTLKRKKFSLIASLPENSYEMAKIAWEAGADAIKVHINVFHRASQNTFGPLTEIRNTFERIIADSPVPVGIVAGEDPILVENVTRSFAIALSPKRCLSRESPTRALTC